MSAQLQRNQQTKKKKKLILTSKLELPAETLKDAVFIPHEDSVITVASDKSIRVWIKRESGQYWPSICHYMPETGLCLSYDKESGKVFVGLTSGMIQEYDLSDDCNKLVLQRNYLAHSKNVRSVLFALDYHWLISCGNDKLFQWHCSKSGKRLGGYASKSWCTALEFDYSSCYAFIGDLGGEIHVLRLEANNNNLKQITILKGHSGSVQCLAWDSEKKWLYSGSGDQSIIIWDIGGQKGSALELNGHVGKINSLALCTHPQLLFSIGDDEALTVWNMSAERIETPTWSQSDICEKCASPFFWNFKQMWDQKVVGVRQHHCRYCGRAVCHSCSDKKSTLPTLGYEFEVRLCDECYHKVSDEDKISLASFHDVKHHATHINFDVSRGRILTCGGDTVKIWSVKEHLT